MPASLIIRFAGMADKVPPRANMIFHDSRSAALENLKSLSGPRQLDTVCQIDHKVSFDG